ncbi:glycosyltransferase family 2 protein [Magnetofaba australis]|uniref:glycosyltransferase family 2 protein n=1 Tax=Magnetofaba australis TaxID=1472297 RepID=UPI000A19BF22|nr:glycosyltransferase family 2 protein [Magnetofaba australis]
MLDEITRRDIAELGKFPGSVTLLSWVYNEEALIEAHLQRCFALMSALCDDFEVLVVDDGSRDATPRILAEFARAHPQLRVVTHARNRNVGVAVDSAFNAMSKEYFFVQTVDWSYDLRHARRFLALLAHFDLVKGMRQRPPGTRSRLAQLLSSQGSRARSDTRWAALVSLSNFYLIRLLFGAPFEDYQNIVFGRHATAQRYPRVSRGAFANPELVIRAYSDGLRILEVPIGFTPRRQGKGKGARPLFVLRSALDVLRCWLLWGWRLPRPRGADPLYRLSQPQRLDAAARALCAPLFAQLNAPLTPPPRSTADRAARAPRQ